MIQRGGEGGRGRGTRGARGRGWRVHMTDTYIDIRMCAYSIIMCVCIYACIRALYTQVHMHVLPEACIYVVAMLVYHLHHVLQMNHPNHMPV